MVKAWRGWALWCLAAPIAGVLVVLSAIPAVIGIAFELFKEDKPPPWNEEMHKRYPPKRPL